MNKLLANAYCKLGNMAIAENLKLSYGISCNTGGLEEYLDLFIWAYNNSCVQETQDCSGGNKCNIENILGKLTKYCKDCRPKFYQENRIEKNEDYTEWYESQEYLDCLNVELEQNGYIEPMIDLCKNLNITITTEAFCKAIVTAIAASKIDCFMTTSIDVINACNLVITQLTAEKKCNPTDVATISRGFSNLT
ncbi:MAG TPA: hypothetical protein PKD00_00400 [Burkholderiales bacterium]|nr:hypothetical protein [Burkholderiales bacterium]